jgi:hypothetical protein
MLGPAAVLLVVMVVVAPLVSVNAAVPECRTFAQIYGTGQRLCETMFGDAFAYSTEQDTAYSMVIPRTAPQTPLPCRRNLLTGHCRLSAVQWFFDQSNPNLAVAQQRNLTQGQIQDCHLEYFHKDAPGPEVRDGCAARARRHGHGDPPVTGALLPCPRTLL